MSYSDLRYTYNFTTLPYGEIDINDGKYTISYLTPSTLLSVLSLDYGHGNANVIDYYPDNAFPADDFRRTDNRATQCNRPHT